MDLILLIDFTQLEGFLLVVNNDLSCLGETYLEETHAHTFVHVL